MQKSHVADFFKIAEFAQVIVKVLSAIWIGGLEFRRAFDAQGNKRFFTFIIFLKTKINVKKISHLFLYERALALKVSTM
jgi:hypothetical protein